MELYCSIIQLIILTSLCQQNLSMVRSFNKQKFINDHRKAISLIQWFEPFFICTLGSPDIFTVLSDVTGDNASYAKGSMRSALCLDTLELGRTIH